MPLLSRRKSLSLVIIVALLGFSGCERAPDAPAQTRKEKERPRGWFERSDPVADAIRQQLAQSPKNESNKLLTEFYELRSYKPAWKRGRKLDNLVAALQELRLDGLDPQDYLVARLQDREASPDENDGRPDEAERDILASKAYLSALLHLSRGKLERKQRPRGLIQVSAEGEAGAGRKAPFDMQWAYAAQDNGNIGDAFAQARPQHPVYGALRVAMGQLLEQEAQGGWPRLPAGGALQPGSKSPQVALLRERLAAAGYLTAPSPEDEQYFDETLAEALRQFQREQFLEASGVLSAETRAALNVPIERRIDQMRVNLERARWQLRDLGRDFVLVDVTGYEVRYYRDAEPVLVSRAQVGEVATPTPMLRSEITHITFNPEWNIPPGMMTREILPILEEDPGWLRRNRIRVLDGAGNEVDPYEIDWEDEGYAYMLKQEAGERGALGRAAIRFPNPHFVYMHETPHKKLFERERRAFSNGCIRVEQIMELVQHLLGWDAVDIEAAIADGKTHEVPLPEPVPVLIAYWTIDLHEEGRIAFKPDVYGLDEPTLRLLDAA